MPPLAAHDASQLALFGGQPLFAREQHTLWPILGEAEKAAVARVIDRGILSGPFAPESMAFQEEFAAWVGVKHALLTHSGTSALVLALGAAGVGQGHEVIVPAYTFVATPLSVCQVGAVPIFVDVRPDTCAIDPALIEAAIGPNTKAIMPVHIHGCPADMNEIRAIADKHGLTVIEDAAQAHGATFEGRPVGALVATGGFSLQSSKNLTGGEGGVFVTNDEGMANVANALRNFGQDLRVDEAGNYDTRRPLDGWRSMESHFQGAMYRGNELLAAVARAQLARLPERTAKAQENAAYLIGRLAQLPGVTPPQVPGDRTSVHHKFRVMLDADAAGIGEQATALGPTGLRDRMLEALRAEGLDAGMWERAPQPRQKVFRERKGFPFNQAAPERLAANYDALYPVTSRMLDTSLVLFSHSAPLIAQDRRVVEGYADAFEKVWTQRQALVEPR